jgi:phosphohistidine phosphatase
MKRIWVMRHAKSDWSDGSLADFDRPLNKRGRADAPRMGRWIASHGGPPDRLAASPARRARDTAEQVAKTAGYPPRTIEWRADFYPGETAAYLRYLRSLPEEIGHILLVGHNPSLESLVALLAGGGAAVRLPTAALALLRAEVGRWMDIQPGQVELEGLISPKMLD